jgi:hypothetical protein
MKDPMMKKLRALLAILGVASAIYSCATSCGPDPEKSTSPAIYPSGYTIEKQNQKEPTR